MMRSCSRCAGESSAGRADSGIEAVRSVVDEKQPASSSSAMSAAAGARSRRLSACLTLPTMRPVSVPLGHLDLLWTRRLDARTPTLLDKAPDPDLAAGPFTGLQTRGREGALIALQNGYREVLGPPPPEVDIDNSAAVAHGQHLAFHDCEAPPLGQQFSRFFGPFHGIIWIGPQAKRGGSGRFFGRQQAGS